MSHSPMRPLLALGVGLALLLGLLAGRVDAQQASKPRPVKFYTVDQVELHGLFYPGAKKNDGPCVLIVPEIGGDISMKGWDSLAKKLQERGYPVLAFDLRGCGGSTSVDKDVFWATAHNRAVGAIRSYRPLKPPETINWKDFSPTYYPNLVNDITAAKAFLDTLNSKGDVNSSNVFILGAQSGAVLSALWINEEFRRFRVAGQKPDAQSEGKDLYGCVWLSMKTSVGKSNKRIPLTVSPKIFSALKDKDKKVPMFFLYGDKDSASKSLSTACVDYLQPRKSKKAEIGKKAIQGSGKAAGQELLTNDLGTETMIVKFLDRVSQDKVPNGYDAEKARDFKASTYVWRMVSPSGIASFVRAKPAGEATLLAVPWGLYK